MKQTLKKVMLSLAAMLVGVAALAQVTTSSLNGFVAEESGEPLPGAVVLAVHVPTGSQYHAIANNQGLYAIKGMRAGGPYEVTFTFFGLQTLVVKDVTLQLGESYKLDAKLKEATQTLHEVTVVASKTKFTTEKTGPVTNISSNEINNLPTVSRSITDIAQLSPYANGMSFAGGDGRSTNLTVDGSNFNNNFGLSSSLPGGGSPISMDAIQEAQVVIAPFDVRQTNFIGGGINATTKSGTNTLKGSVYSYFYNDKTHGRKAHGVNTVVPAQYERKIYGATLGGPIIRNKLFFFVSGEYTTSPSVMNNWRGSKDGVAKKEQYISRVKNSDLEEVSTALRTIYGYDTGSWTNYPADISNMKILARMDWNINDANKLAVRYNYTKNQNWIPTNGNSFDGKVRATGNRLSEYGMAYANACYSMDNAVSSISVDLNSRLNERMSNQFLATYSNISDMRGSNSSIFPFIDILHGEDLAKGSVTPYISAGYELFTYLNGVKNDVITVKDDFSYDLGAHHILAGLSYEHQMALNSYIREGTGYYRYRSLDDFYKANGWDPVEHKVITPDGSVAPETVSLTYGYNGKDAVAKVNFDQIGFYIQDEWDVNKKLKLTGGVRFDTIIFDEKDIMTNNAIKALDFGGRHIDTGKWPATNLMISPRLGFTYNVFGDGSLKLRGGAGVFTGRMPLVYLTNMPTNSNMIQNLATLSTSWKGAVGTPDPLLANFGGKMITDKAALLDKLNSLDPKKYPKTISPEDGVVGSKLGGVDPNFKMPMVAKASLGVDYAFPVDFPLSISAEGMYTKLIHGTFVENYNLKASESANWTRMKGVDDRLLYPKDSKYNPGLKNDAFVLSNVNQGYGYTGNVTINASPVRALNFMLSYTKTESKELTGMPGNDPASVYQGLYSINGAQFATLQRSQYVVPDRVIGSLSYRHNFFKLEGFDTNISLRYTGMSSGGYSFYFDNDINGDGVVKDLIYIPKKPTDLRWASPEDMMGFWNFVNQDKYLKSHKGQYAEASAARAPWVHNFDLRFSQDLAVKIGKSLNRLQFSLDIMNVGNLLNQNWGIPYILDCNNGAILHCTNVEDLSSGAEPVYQFVGNSDHTYTHSSAFYNCWQIQLGVRYLFN